MVGWGRGWRRKSAPSPTCSSLRARTLVLLSASVGWAFSPLGLAWTFPCTEAEFTQALWSPWRGWCGKRKPSVTAFNLTVILRTPVHRAGCARSLREPGLCRAMRRTFRLNYCTQTNFHFHILDIQSFFPPFLSPHWQLKEPFFFLTPSWHSLYQHVKAAEVIHMETSSSVA